MQDHLLSSEAVTGSHNLVSSPATASLIYPNDVFEMQNNVSDNLNKFQIRYSRYLRCQNPETATDVSDPPCNLNTIDSFSELTTAYKTLYNSMDTVQGVYPDQTTRDGVTNDTYDANAPELNATYKDVSQLQQSLDQKLKFIQDRLTAKDNSSELMLSSRNLINTLLIILIVCIAYYIFIEL